MACWYKDVCKEQEDLFMPFNTKLAKDDQVEFKIKSKTEQGINFDLAGIQSRKTGGYGDG